jgi:hypothetical protein
MSALPLERVEYARLEMPLRIHALMQNAHDQNAVGLDDVKNHVRLVVRSPQPCRQLDHAPVDVRRLRELVKPLREAAQIDPRLCEPEFRDRIFIERADIRCVLGESR